MRLRDPAGTDGQVRSERTARLHEVVSVESEGLLYRYDFGDDGYHDLVVEQVLPPQQHPRHDELRDWVGGGFDPAAFDAGQTDNLLRSL